MLTAIKNTSKIELLSLQLLKIQLEGDAMEFWKVYDSLIELFGYSRIFINHKQKIIRKHQQENLNKYTQFMIKKISRVDQLQKLEMNKFWKTQLTNSHTFQDRNNMIYCILSPINLALNLAINKLKDYDFIPYAFVNQDKVIYANICAQKKGVLQGLPLILAEKIDPHTKFIEINEQTSPKWTDLFEILKEKYNGVQLIDKGESILLVLRNQQSQNRSDSMQMARNILKQQVGLMIEEIFSISGVKLVGVMSQSQMVSEMISKYMQLSELSHNKSMTPIVLLTKEQMQVYIGSLKLRYCSELSISHVYFLSSIKIHTIRQLLQNLWILQIILSREQTMIIMLSLIGIDYRSLNEYIQQKERQYQQFGLNYNAYIDEYQMVKQNTLQELKIQTLNKQKLKQKKLRAFQDSDMDSIKSEKINNIYTKESKTSKSQTNYKPQNNSKKTPSIISKQHHQQSLTGFVKKTKK